MIVRISRLCRTKLIPLLFVIIFLKLFFISLIKNQPHNDSNSADAPQIQIDAHSMIDWHDYSQIAEDKQRVGPGERGRPLDNPKNFSNYQLLYQANGFNGAGSDQISLERAVPDIRPQACSSMKYRKNLPTVSVIIPFHGEHWTTLLRTFISILRRSPQHLIKEILLVDDASTKEFLKEKLEAYIKQYPKVRVLRMNGRSGLVRTRLAGAKEATGDVLIFLDSHVEANVNWLPPLLDPIAENYRTVVCPFIDLIDGETFAYGPQDGGGRGAFNWFLLYKRLPRLEEDKQSPARPFDSPVMAGGLFAISRRWFWELGGYDTGLEYWGAEQYEISFKIWMCGGRMVDAPCSRVGHIFRTLNPTLAGINLDFLRRNHKRIVEVWMDEYKHYIYDRSPEYLSVDEGNLSQQREIRRKLNCKSFDWFMKNIAFDLTKSYPLQMPGNGAEGHVWNDGGSNQLCLTASALQDKNIISGSPCNDNSEKFHFDWRGTIRLSSKPHLCFDFNGKLLDGIQLIECHNLGGNQKWQLQILEKKIIHVVSWLCLEVSPDQRKVFMNQCASENVHQVWDWSQVSQHNMNEAHRQTI